MGNSMQAMELESENVWVSTQDGQKITMPLWQIDHIKVLKSLFSRQQGANSYHNPVEVRTTEDRLSLVQRGLDVIKKSGNFCNFYNGLSYHEQIRFDNVIYELGVDALNKAVENCDFPGSIRGISF